jgi:hypothetical protein
MKKVAYYTHLILSLKLRKIPYFLPKKIYKTSVEHYFNRETQKKRRWVMNETDEMVNKKLKVVLKNNLVPILAIGEKERKGNYKDFIINELNSALDGIDLKNEKIF